MPGLVIAITGGDSHGRRLVQGGEVLVGQLDIGGNDVVLEVGAPLRARNRDDPALVQHPCQGKLRRSHTFGIGQGPYLVDDSQVVCQILLAETGHAPAPVTFWQIVSRGDRPRQDASAQR